VKRLLAALAGLVGIAWWRNRPRPLPALAPQPDPAADRAEELRAKLAQARDADDREEFEAGETPVDEAVSAEDVETRRRSVHDRARAARDDLSPPE
jgi:hypothetical protein